MGEDRGGGVDWLGALWAETKVRSIVWWRCENVCGLCGIRCDAMRCDGG